MNIGFDNQKYVKMQSEKILERVNNFGGKLYLEFGGKLFDDYHASRVLPGFHHDAKIKLLQSISDKAEIIFCISACDIERNKIRADFGITYEMDLMRVIDKIRGLNISVSSIVITKYKEQAVADIFINKLRNRGEKVYIHTLTKGYPMDIDTITSDEGYGANSYIETYKPLVVVAAPGPGSGKLATCMSQLYHDYKAGIRSGYAKFETFPVWNLPLKHPVNAAYEAATADIGDFNMIDPYHLDAYGVTTVNYNRDIEVFPIVKNILNKITGEEFYRSPTDMGVNMAGFAIFDEEKIKIAARQEIIRRYYKINCDYKQGLCAVEAVQRIALIMKEQKIEISERKTVSAALEKEQAGGSSSVAIELKNGEIICGKTTNLMTAGASVLLNTVKRLSKIDDDMHLLAPLVLQPILKLKKEALNEEKVILNMEEVLIALSICAATNPVAEKAVNKLKELSGLEAHSTCMLIDADANIMRKLKINITCEAIYPSKELFCF